MCVCVYVCVSVLSLNVCVCVCVLSVYVCVCVQIGDYAVVKHSNAHYFKCEETDVCPPAACSVCSEQRDASFSELMFTVLIIMFIVLR